VHRAVVARAAHVCRACIAADLVQRRAHVPVRRVGLAGHVASGGANWNRLALGLAGSLLYLLFLQDITRGVVNRLFSGDSIGMALLLSNFEPGGQWTAPGMACDGSVCAGNGLVPLLKLVQETVVDGGQAWQAGLCMLALAYRLGCASYPVVLVHASRIAC
jgi:hypothetical protein